MTDQNAITPPTDLQEQWEKEALDTHYLPYGFTEHIATRAAQWGADQELEACVQWIKDYPWAKHVSRELLIETLRAARRPKPPSLKEQALDALSQIEGDDTPTSDDFFSGIEIIRIALEQLND